MNQNAKIMLFVALIVIFVLFGKEMLSMFRTSDTMRSRPVTTGGSETHTKTVRDPHFSNIKKGKKTVEGRLRKPSFEIIKEGDKVRWVNLNDAVLTKITKRVEYDSFEEMIRNERIENVLPGCETIEEGVGVYRQFYSEEQEKEFGVYAFHLEVM